MPSYHLILCHPLLLSPSIFPSIGAFQISQLFASGGQNIGVSASASVLPMNIQDWFPLGWTGWITLQSKSLSRVFFSNTTVQKAFFIDQLSHPYMTTGKTIALTRRAFVGKVISLLFNMLSPWMKLLSPVWLFVTPWTIAHQAPPSMGFSRQEYWSGLPFPSPGDLPDPGIEPGSPDIVGRRCSIWATRAV